MSGVWLASYIVLWLVVLVLAFLLAGSLRQLGLIQLRLGPVDGRHWCARSIASSVANVALMLVPGATSDSKA